MGAVKPRRICLAEKDGHRGPTRFEACQRVACGTAERNVPPVVHAAHAPHVCIFKRPGQPKGGPGAQLRAF
jgi:hypothetical protein